MVRTGDGRCGGFFYSKTGSCGGCPWLLCGQGLSGLDFIIDAVFW